jgi:hypothetical protein
VAAVFKRLDATPDGVAIDDDDREGLNRMLIVVRRIADATPVITPDALA